jgi:predicted anti-sigma-YlaC factor YlaD
MKTGVKCFYKTECSKTGEQLTSYLDGELGDKEQAQLELHLESCRSCREEYDSLRQTVSLLQQIPEVSSERTFRIDEKNVAQKTGDRNLLVLYRAAVGVAIILALVCIGDFGHLFTTIGDQPLDGLRFWSVRGIELGLLVVLIVLISRILIRLFKRRK